MYYFNTVFHLRPAWILSFYRMSVAMVFFGLSLNTSNLNGNVYLNCFISAATDIVAYLGTWVLISHVPRPTVLFSTLMFCGLIFLIIQLVPKGLCTLSMTMTESGLSKNTRRHDVYVKLYCLV